jgi:cell division septation protein DedD
MLTVEGIIGDLLLRHNCVIVPSFGGFVTQRIGAQLDKLNGTMTPPRKAILFNRQLINNDGLLITSFAQLNKVGYDEAQAQISEAVAHWDVALKQGQRISIDRVGFLYFDQERNLCFEQDRFYNLLLESYGLSAIHFVSAADVEAQTSHTVIREMVKEALAEPIVDFIPSQIEPAAAASGSDEAPVIPMKQAVRPVRVWRYVAAAALLPIAFYSFWIPMKTDVLESGILSVSDFNPFHKTSPASYKPSADLYSANDKTASRQLETIPEGISVFSFSVDDDWYIPVKLTSGETTAATSPSIPENHPETTVEQPTASSSGSHIIVGCFSDANNAANLVKTLRAKGFDAKILNGKGLIRVSAGDGAQFNELNPKLKAEGLEGWVLK